MSLKYEPSSELQAIKEAAMAAYDKPIHF